MIVDPDGPSADVPVFAPATHETRQGFLRVINRGERTVVHIDAVDDAGNRQTSSLAIDAGETLHFNSGDLENGNFDKGLSRGVGSGTGDWRLKLLGNAVEVLAYMRTGTGSSRACTISCRRARTATPYRRSTQEKTSTKSVGCA